MPMVNEMNKNDYLRICNLMIDLRDMAEKYNVKELKYSDIKITIEKDKDAEKVVR